MRWRELLPELPPRRIAVSMLLAYAGITVLIIRAAWWQALGIAVLLPLAYALAWHMVMLANCMKTRGVPWRVFFGGCLLALAFMGIARFYPQYRPACLLFCFSAVVLLFTVYGAEYWPPRSANYWYHLCGWEPGELRFWTRVLMTTLVLTVMLALLSAAVLHRAGIVEIP